MKKMRKLLSLLALAGAIIALPVGNVDAMASESNTAMQQNDDTADTVDDEENGYMVDEQGRIIVSYGFYEKAKNENWKYGNAEELSDDGNQLTFFREGREYIVKNLTREQRVRIEDTIADHSKSSRRCIIFLFVVLVFGEFSLVGLYITLFKD